MLADRERRRSRSESSASSSSRRAGDRRADLERRGRRGRRRVQHVHGPARSCGSRSRRRARRRRRSPARARPRATARDRRARSRARAGAPRRRTAAGSASAPSRRRRSASCGARTSGSPERERLAQVARRRRAATSYPSRANASTAFGPTCTCPSIPRVRCTPRNGNCGSGTGYTRPRTRCARDGTSSRYSPRNAMTRMPSPPLGPAHGVGDLVGVEARRTSRRAAPRSARSVVSTTSADAVSAPETTAHSSRMVAPAACDLGREGFGTRAA